MTAPPSPPTSPAQIKRKSDLNAAHVAAAALAAVTAAVLGSRLGAAGTLVGAGGASVITTIATAVYRASLEHSQKRVRSLARRTRSSPTFRKEAGTERSNPVATAPLDDKPSTDRSDRGQRIREHSRRLATLRWGAVAVGAVGAFVLAMLVITGFEAARGETVGGNGTGTTIGHVVNSPPRSQNHTPAITPTPTPSSTPASETPTATTAPSTSTTPDGGSSVEQTPSVPSGTPAPTSVTPPPSLLPPGLPGSGGRSQQNQSVHPSSEA